MVVLPWLQGHGNCKQFEQNRIHLITAKGLIVWNYVNSNLNPANLGSRGCPANKLGDIWWKGPDWLQNSKKWPTQIEIKANEESEKEANLIKEVMCTAIVDKTIFDNLLDKHDYRKFIRITT